MGLASGLPVGGTERGDFGRFGMISSLPIIGEEGMEGDATIPFVFGAVA